MKILLLLPIITLFLVGCATKPEPVIVVTSEIQVEQSEPESEPELKPEPEPTTVSGLLKKRNYVIQKSGDGYTIKCDYTDQGNHYKLYYTLHGQSTVNVGDTTFEIDEDGALKITIKGIGTQRLQSGFGNN